MSIILSGSWISKLSECEITLRFVPLFFKVFVSISLKFFFFFKILRASLVNPLPMTISKNILFNSFAIILSILKLQETIPPKALIGSQLMADFKLLSLLSYTV